MKGLNQDLKDGRFSQAYLLYGDEDYLRIKYCRALSSAICDPSDTMNYSYFEGSGCDPLKIIDTAETLPFFKERRLIVIRDSSFFSKSCDALADYLKEPCPSTFFIFTEEKAASNTRMFKAVQKLGRCVKLTTQTDDELIGWASSILDRAGKRTYRNTLLRLFDRSGRNMGILNGELEKLISYTGGREIITDEDVDTISTVSLQDRIFKMISAVTDRKSSLAFSMYYELIALKTPSTVILSNMWNEFRKLMMVKELSASVRDPEVIASRAGLSQGLTKVYMNKAAGYSKGYLRAIMDKCLEMDRDFKSGLISDRLSVELLLFAVSRRKGS